MLTVFNFQDYPIRFVGTPDNPLWIAKDVCDCLDIKNYRDACSKLDDDERVSVKTTSSGGVQSVICVNESGLYGLIFQSRKPSAKAFRKWVTKEVLPSIRKTGGYSVNSGLVDSCLAVAFEGCEDDKDKATRVLCAVVAGAFDPEIVNITFHARQDEQSPFLLDLIRHQQMACQRVKIMLDSHLREVERMLESHSQSIRGIGEGK